MENLMHFMIPYVQSYDIWNSHVLRTLQGSQVVAMILCHYENEDFIIQSVINWAFIIQSLVDLDAYTLPCSGDDMRSLQ